VVDQLRTHSTTIGDWEASRVTTSNLVVKQRAERLAVQTTVLAVKAYVAGTLGTASAVYAALGFAPKKRDVPSAAVKAAAAAKALATRVKRHIMGKNQRAAIPPATMPDVTPTASSPAVPAVTTQK
jgi:hypothetical protein